MVVKKRAKEMYPLMDDNASPIVYPIEDIDIVHLTTNVENEINLHPDDVNIIVSIEFH